MSRLRAAAPAASLPRSHVSSRHDCTSDVCSGNDRTFERWLGQQAQQWMAHALPVNLGTGLTSQRGVPAPMAMACGCSTCCGYPGLPLAPLATLGHPFGCPWLPLATLGYPCLPLATLRYRWLPLATLDYPWLPSLPWATLVVPWALAITIP